ncbi:MAG: 16S rRNA (cytidine(1402)-2'-O)-methyltransferase [Patescibacteria group bacterium]
MNNVSGKASNGMSKSFDKTQGKLSVVATPIGNLADITLRALETLKAVDAIYCEDTRVTSKLLARYAIRKPLFRLDAVTERKKTPEVITRLKKNEHIALVSDAGTPGGLSDPGAYLVEHVRAELPDAKIESIPGPSSLTAALSVAGVLANDFLFLGFLPHKKGRQTALRELAASERPVVLFESPHRIRKLMNELKSLVPRRRVVVVRELTKMFESAVEGLAADIPDLVERGTIPERGEFVVIVAPH